MWGRSLAGFLFAGSVWAQTATPVPPITIISNSTARPSVAQVEIDSFEKVWATIRDAHWQTSPGGLDWKAIHAEFRPRIEQATSAAQARAITQEMLGRLKQTHFGILPSTVYSAVQPTSVSESAGTGAPDFELRVIDGEAVITSVYPVEPWMLDGPSRNRNGIRPGWIIQSVAGELIRPVIQQALANPEINELQLTRSLMARFSGPRGTAIDTVFAEPDGATPQVIRKSVVLTAPRGEMSSFGNLPTSPVWFENKRIANADSTFAEYFRLNIFLDIPRVMPAFEHAVKDCIAAGPATCRGLIIDLRGNPGGIGGMAMGMAGFLVEQANQRLGTMYMREATLNFVINPRPETYAGPVAILLDSNSASTSEIFAGGLQDLHRARIFGTRSAAAALPSLFERLPNGDGFQYAVANYVSQGGLPLEGIGVTPDQEVKLTRSGLLEGHDAVVDAASGWIAGVQTELQNKGTQK